MSAEKSSTVHQGPSSAVELAGRDVEGKDFHMIDSRLSYCKDTGAITWKNISRYHIEKLGSTAGTRNSKGYIKIRISGKLYSAHRIAWLITFGYWPAVIDHINGDRSDNRISNLRDTNFTINAQNHRKRHREESRMPLGVRALKSGSYQARCTVNGRCYNLGCYPTKKEAYNAYIMFSDKHHNNPAVN